MIPLLKTDNINEIFDNHFDENNNINLLYNIYIALQLSYNNKFNYIKGTVPDNKLIEIVKQKIQQYQLQFLMK